MASTGKKGKKPKGKTFALTDFLHETPGETPTIPIRKSNNPNWADEVEDVIDQYDNRPKANVVLPTAPKASRGLDDFSDKIPQKPPFLAYLSNLPYDINENEIAEFFSNLRVAGMRMPKEGEGQKLRGFGYVEFEDRESLIGALSITDCTLKNRRIRIELATNSEHDRRRGGRSDNNRDRPERPEVSSGDWRSGPRAEPAESERSDRSRVSFNRERDDRDKGSSGSWRDSSDRPSFRDSDNRSFSRDSDRRFSDKDGDKRGPSRRTDRDDLSHGNKDDVSSEPRTRTKLVLAPRSISEKQEMPTLQPVPAPVPAASIFGSAKPVDTSAREREIEDRLAKQSEKPATTDNSREIRRDAWGKRNEEEGRGRRNSPRRSLDRSPNRNRRNSLDRKGSPVQSYRKNSPDRRSPDDRRRSSEPKWRSPVRGRSPDRRYTSNKKYSPPRRHSPDSRYSPDRKFSPDKGYSPDRSNLSDRSSSPDYNRRSPPRGKHSPEHQSPSRKSPPIHRKLSLEHKRSSPNRRKSPEIRRRSPEAKKSPDRGRTSNLRKNADDKRSAKVDRNSQKNHKKEEKASRDNHDRDMPKMKEPEPPNFAASNKYAFLEADDSD